MLNHDPRSRAPVFFLGVILACGCCASGGSQLRTGTTDQAGDARVLFWHDSFELLPDESYYSTFFRPYRFSRVTEEARAGPAPD